MSLANLKLGELTRTKLGYIWCSAQAQDLDPKGSNKF